MSTRVDLTGLTTADVDDVFHRVAAGQPETEVVTLIRQRATANRQATINATAAILAEMVALGMTEAAAQRITDHTVARFLTDATEDHNGLPAQYRTVQDRPGDNVVDRLPAEHYPAAGTICIALVQLVRAAGGLACPEMGLPMAYAAEAVTRAIRTSRTN